MTAQLSCDRPTADRPPAVNTMPPAATWYMFGSIDGYWGDNIYVLCMSRPSWRYSAAPPFLFSFLFFSFLLHLPLSVFCENVHHHHHHQYHKNERISFTLNHERTSLLKE